MNKILLALVLAVFGAYSSWATLQVGYLGIWRAGLDNPGALQVLADLVIVCSLAMLWILGDARKSGRNPWPYVLLTVFLGSFGPLLYLLIGELSRSPNMRRVPA